ncbi:hypothetical protein V7139_31180 [Neobacillus drentensis]|uniref:hypothetical protein n=1 Tax=Neobacillus drentensis TaxID=220684 RepID=UPI003002C6A4
MSRSYISLSELSQDIAAAWEKREGKKYYLVNEKYTSTVYLNASPIIPIHTVKGAPGYVSNNKIIGADKAVNGLQIPGMAGRDAMEINFLTKNGSECVTAVGKVASYLQERWGRNLSLRK